MRSQLIQEFLPITEDEKLVVQHMPEIVNADPACSAFAKGSNTSAGIRPLMWVERAIIDCADRVG